MDGGIVFKDYVAVRFPKFQTYAMFVCFPVIKRCADDGRLVGGAPVKTQKPIFQSFEPHSEKNFKNKQRSYFRS